MLLLRQVRYLIGAALLTACQSDPGTPLTLSLEEAKQVTASFEGKGFVPPPRTVRDITAILEKEKQEDLAYLESAQKRADEPASASASALFFLKRGQAAGSLGRDKQKLEDLREAYRMTKNESGYVHSQAALEYGIVEATQGNFSRGIAALEDSHGVSGDAGQVSRSSILAAFLAEAGYIVRAEEVLEEAAGLIKRLSVGGSDLAMGRAIHQTMFANARAEVLAARGDLRQAEQLLRQAESRWRPYKDRQWPAEARMAPDTNASIYNWLASNLAEVLAKQGRLVEAEVEARKSLLGALGLYGGYSSDTAFMLGSLIQVVLEQGRVEDGEQLARAMVGIFERTGAPDDSFGLALARGLLADSLVAQGKWKKGLEQFAEIERGLAGDKGTLDKLLSRNVNRAIAYVAVGKPDEAVEMLRPALARQVADFGYEHDRTAMTRGVLSVALAARGERREAASEFARALPALLAHHQRYPGGESGATGAIQRLRFIIESYLALIADAAGTPLADQMGATAAEAFRLADIARGQAVRRALAASAARARISDPDLADLARRAQDAEKQVAALSALLADNLERPRDQRDPTVVADLRDRVSALREAHGTILKEIATRFPDYARLINPKPATVEEARATLRPGEALIATYVGRERTYVWAIPRSGSIAFAVAAIGGEDLSDTVAILRSALEPNAATLGDIPEFDLAAAHDLYEKLLEPVKAGWKEARSLLMVAHGPLGYLPFSLLPTAAAPLPPEGGGLFANYRDIPWLARSHAVTVLPSVASLRTLRGLPPGRSDRKAYAGFGDPLFSPEQAAQPEPGETATLTSRGLKTRGLPVSLRAAPATAGLDSAGLASLPRLPDTADEIRSTAVALNADLTRDVFLGRRANEGIVKSMNLSGYKVIAFATHGLVPGDLNGLTQPALALTSPKVTGDPDNDGLLTMGEILGLKLNSDWVVLSACNTGSGQGAGAEAVSGLGRAFFYAGTRALLVSNWPVETTSAKALTTDLFKRQAANDNLARAEALRQSMLNLIDGPGYVDPESGKTVFSYAHPIFWAPFSLIGDGGGLKPAS